LTTTTTTTILLHPSFCSPIILFRDQNKTSRGETQDSRERPKSQLLNTFSISSIPRRRIDTGFEQALQA
jgi:hypothetical protein